MSDDKTSRVAKQLDYCSFCPKMCRFSCPVAEASGKESHTPGGKMTVLGQLHNGQRPWNQEQIESLWACTGCKHCTVYCDHDIEPGLVLQSGRRYAAERGITHPGLQDYRSRFKRRDVRLSERMRKELSEWHDPDATVVFWPGCDAISKSPDEIERLMEAMKKLGVSISLPASGQGCAGYPLMAAGLMDEFRFHGARVVQSMRRAKKVVMNCSACLVTMNDYYRAEGIDVPFKVISTAEFFLSQAQKVDEPNKKETVYYHDPCYLARHAEITEEPRQVLRRFAKVLEFGWSGQDSECCGGAGLLPKTMPETSDNMAKSRLAEISGRGGGTVITSCSTCSFVLRRNAPSGVTVKDLTTFFAEKCSSNASQAGSDDPGPPTVPGKAI